MDLDNPWGEIPGDHRLHTTLFSWNICTAAALRLGCLELIKLILRSFSELQMLQEQETDFKLEINFDGVNNFAQN